MSPLTQAMSPGRKRALALSGAKIRASQPHAAPDGRPSGAGADALAGAKPDAQLLSTAGIKPAARRSVMPLSRRASK